MIEVALMVEGQDGLNWHRWQRVARLADDLGFAGLYRSDHFVGPQQPDKESLELWVSLAWLADNTERISFGPLVTPLSFRHPVHTARMASAVDDLSGGRLVLGLGAGWMEREHEMYGWDLLELPERFLRFEEGLEVVIALLKRDNPVSLDGNYYKVNDATMLPRPQRIGGPPILIGGNGPKYTLPLAARFADEWNAVYLSEETFRSRSSMLDELLQEQGRSSWEVRRSMMTGLVFGSNSQELEYHARKRSGGRRGPDELREQGAIVGTASDVTDQLLALSEAGLQKVMLQWLDLDNLAPLEIFASVVLPEVMPSAF